MEGSYCMLRTNEGEEQQSAELLYGARVAQASGVLLDDKLAARNKHGRVGP